jgi:polysaccharide biosynthesis/export protein
MRVVFPPLFFAFCTLTCMGQERANGSAQAGYLLGSGDQLVIRAANVPDISEKPVRIDLTGNINMPTIGHIHAGGLTVDQLEAEIVKRLKVYLEEPDVAVSISEYQSQPVSIFGEVGAPGVHQLQGHKTLVEMLATSGGVRTSAGPSVRITRLIENGPIPLPGATTDPTGRFSVAELQLKPLVAAQTPELDIEIKPNDIISVPKAELIYIAGEGIKSTLLTLNDGPTMSVMQALASAGGINKTADPKNGKILREVAGKSMREQVPVDISKIMKGKSTDVQLTAGDILFVPASASKKATMKALEVAIQIGTVVLSSGMVNGTL